MNVERADLRLIFLDWTWLACSFVDLDIAVVAVFVRHGNCSTRVEQQHDDREHAQEFFDPAHRLIAPFNVLTPCGSASRWTQGLLHRFAGK